jgi:hypothetical protein
MAFFAAPPKAHAVIPVFVDGSVNTPTFLQNLATNLITTAKSVITAIETTLTAIHTFTSMLADYANWVRTWILEPLAFILSGKLIRMLVSGVIAYVIGQANGTGIPQFITNVYQTVHSVQDSQALAYLRNMNQTQSPFSSSIASALSADYLAKTTLAGFWAANQNTLARSSPTYSPAYLQGSWADGGLAAWFALTTQVQNNPYSLYLNSQQQLSTLVGPGVGGASGAKLAEASWGQGFLSWCGTSADMSAATAGAHGCTAGQVFDSVDGCVTPQSTSSTGVKPGDTCTQSDGTPGVIKTPASVIKATLDKVMGATQDQIVRMGDIATEINSILGNVATIMQTVNYARQILGGSYGSSGGLSGGLLSAGAPTTSGATAQLQQLANSTNEYGVTSSSIQSQTLASQQAAQSADTGAAAQSESDNGTSGSGSGGSTSNNSNGTSGSWGTCAGPGPCQ